MSNGGTLDNGNGSGKRIPTWFTNILIGLCTTAILGGTAMLLKMDRTVTSFISTHAATHQQIDDILAELKNNTLANQQGVTVLREEFASFSSRTDADRYTIQQAYADQRQQAEELRRVWDSIHTIQLDVVRMQDAQDAQ